MPEPARRSRLTTAQSAERFDHPGLALHRYLAAQDDNDAVRHLLKTAAHSPAPDPYRVAYKRWEQLQKDDEVACAFTATLARPMAIGLGGESALEVGLTTHHAYGMPLIPGSALKGMLRRADPLPKTPTPQQRTTFDTLFGTTDAASFFTFFDAWYDPASVDGKPFKQDVITVHHPRYYIGSSQTRKWPTDFDDPNPVPFLVVKPGARFLFSVHGPSPEWCTYIAPMLKWALQNLGVGAKTNAGYGYFTSQFADILRPIRWRNCTVRKEANNHDLTAVHGQEKAFLRGDEARLLVDTLPPELQARLRQKPRQVADVTVTVKIDGNNRTIVGIQAA